MGSSVEVRMTLSAKGLPGLSKGWCRAYSSRARWLFSLLSCGPGLQEMRTDQDRCRCTVNFAWFDWQLDALSAAACDSDVRLHMQWRSERAAKLCLSPAAAGVVLGLCP
jgi:hypothetical protein